MKVFAGFTDLSLSRPGIAAGSASSHVRVRVAAGIITGPARGLEEPPSASRASP